MKANELRIGNLLSFDGEIVKLVSIISSSLRVDCYYGDNDEYIADFSLASLSPIPLTPEILEKCGFDCVSGHYWELLVNIENGYKLLFLISFDNNTMAIEDSHGSIINIKLPESLHQLQNLIFSLTGEELNYKP